MDEGWERSLRKQREECLERDQRGSSESDGEDEEGCDERFGSHNFRHPVAGHVLYLDVGSDARGPTVVFDAANGGDLVARAHDQSDADATVRMYSVPAVGGRLLRFRGDRLHAVPRPHDVYWTLDVSGNNDQSEGFRRSVLLFNLWDPEATPLSDTVLDCGEGTTATDRGATARRPRCGGGDDTKDNHPEPPGPSADPACARFGEWTPVPVALRASAPTEDVGGSSFPGDSSPLWSSLPWDLLAWLLGGIGSSSSSAASDEAFQVPLSGDPTKRGISGYVARMRSSSWWNETTRQRVHPARDNLGEAFLPTVTTAFADEWFVEEAPPDKRQRQQDKL
mmetsp:Transcript_9808/g.22354  ORF Transcript_9808/g.22354 Transcript_9808/m.22354 type:complete len:337 (-) Transcript_9808:139-1149(-)